MATFMFVTGAWHGPWSVQALGEALTRRGHTALLPELPLGLEDATLDNWASHIVDAAGLSREPVILVGHSRGGIVVSAAAERAPHLFRSLAYVTAFLLPNEMSMAMLVDREPRSPEFDAGLTSDGAFLTLDPETAVKTFANKCESEYRRFYASRLVVEPIQPMTVPLKLAENGFGSLPRLYVECTEDLAIPIELQRKMVSAVPCDKVESLQTDHTPMLSAKDDLANILDRWASSTTRR